MNRLLEEALAQCLARMDEGASIEDCLSDQAPVAADLRPLLEAAQALRGQGDSIPEYSATAFQKGRERMHSARTRQAEGGGRASIFLGWLFGRPAAILAVAVVVAVLATLGFTSDLFRFDADTTSADVQGVVSRVDPDVIVLTTADGLVIIHIGENTIVLDADGNLIRGGDIVPGKPATVEVQEENGGLAAQRIEVEDDDEQGHSAEVEFSGLVQTASDSTIEVQASFGVATVRIDSQTEVRGALAAGATVKVHATAEGDGSYLAREIEVEGPDGSDDGGQGDGRGDDGGGTSGSGSGDHEDADRGISGSGTGDYVEDGVGFSGSGSGDHEDANSDISGSGSGDHEDANSDISGSGSGDHEDANGGISGSGSGDHEDADGGTSGSGSDDHEEDGSDSSGSRAGDYVEDGGDSSSSSSGDNHNGDDGGYEREVE